MGHRLIIPENVVCEDEVISMAAAFGQNTWKEGDLEKRAAHIGSELGKIVVISSLPFFNPLDGREKYLAYLKYLEAVKRQSEDFNNELANVFGQSFPPIIYLGHSGGYFSQAAKACLTDDFPPAKGLVALEPVGFEEFIYTEGLRAELKAVGTEYGTTKSGYHTPPDPGRQKGLLRLKRHTGMICSQLFQAATQGHAWKYSIGLDLTHSSLRRNPSMYFAMVLAERSITAFQHINSGSNSEQFLGYIAEQLAGYPNIKIFSSIPDTNHDSFENDDLYISICRNLADTVLDNE